MKTSAIQVNGEKILGQASIAESIANPTTKRPTNTARVEGRRGPEANRSIQRKLRISSAVSNTAGATTVYEIVLSRSWSGSNSSGPRYSQFPVRRLISSNDHHTGAEMRNSRTKSLRERIQMELPVRICTRASATRMYPSHKGKNR